MRRARALRLHAGDDAAEVRRVPAADLAALEETFLDDHFPGLTPDPGGR